MQELKKLYNYTKKRLSDELLRLKINQGYEDKLQKALEKNDEDAITNIYTNLVEYAFNEGKVEDFNDLNSIAREYQAMVNHFPIEGVSRFIEAVVYYRDEAKKNKPADLAKYTALILKTHQEIDRFLKEEKINGNEMESAAHHTLNWLGQIMSEFSVKKTDRELAAITLHILKRYHEKMTGYQFIFTNKQLDKLAGKKGKTFVSKQSQKAFQEIISAIEDPALLFTNNEIIPEDWEDGYNLLFLDF